MKKDKMFLLRWYKKAKILEVKRRIKFIQDINAGHAGNQMKLEAMINWVNLINKLGWSRVSEYMG